MLRRGISCGGLKTKMNVPFEPRSWVMGFDGKAMIVDRDHMAGEHALLSRFNHYNLEFLDDEGRL